MKHAYTPRVGCAGWSIPGAHAALFDGDGTHLQRYARRFDCVEINSSFYRPHQPKTYAKWAAQVPDGFRFAVKFPRAGTHEAKLVGADAVIDRFVGEVTQLGDRLGPILVQMPPSLAFDARVADTFFAALRNRVSTPIVCEPRHRSWFEPRVDAVWDRHDVSRVAADPVRIPEGAVTSGAGHVRYWRLHGAPRIYHDEYGDARLAPWAQAMRAARDDGFEVWAILDNTALGHATVDALRLDAMLAPDA